MAGLETTRSPVGGDRTTSTATPAPTSSTPASDIAPSSTARTASPRPSRRRRRGTTGASPATATMSSATRSTSSTAAASTPRSTPPDRPARLMRSVGQMCRIPRCPYRHFARLKARGMSETGVDGLALERQHPEDALVDPVQGLAGDEPLEGFDAEGELPEGERPLVAEAAGPQPSEV